MKFTRTAVFAVGVIVMPGSKKATVKITATMDDTGKVRLTFPAAVSDVTLSVSDLEALAQEARKSGSTSDYYDK